MRDFKTHTAVSGLMQHRILIPVLVVLVFGSAAFAAVGGRGADQGAGLSRPKSMARSSTRGEVVPNEDGSASFTIPLGGQVEGDIATVDMTFDAAGSGDAGGEGGTVTIDISADDDELQVDISPVQPEEEEDDGDD